jgi:serine/threonine protein kinase
MSSDLRPVWSELLAACGGAPPTADGSWPPHSWEFSPGVVIGNQWEVQHFLGEGASAEVYAVRSTTSERSGAVKVLRRQFAQHEGKLAQFQREVEVVVTLESPWTVRLLDRGSLPDGRPYIVFERLTGQSLHAMLQERKLVSEAPYFTLNELVDICHCVLLSLRELHGKDLLHRDIKPRNLQCIQAAGTSLQVKVMDFGIAGKPASKRDGELRVLGSPHYVAPEVARGESVGPASDLYSLGITLIELIAGEPPWAGRLQDDLLYSHMNPDLQVPLPDVVRLHALGKVIAQAVAKSTDDRFESAMTMLGAIDDAMTLARVSGLARSGNQAPAETPARGTTHVDDLPSLGRALVTTSGSRRVVAPVMAPPLLFDAPPVAAPGPVVAAQPNRWRVVAVVLMVLSALVLGMLLGLLLDRRLAPSVSPAAVVVPASVPQGVAVPVAAAGQAGRVVPTRQVDAEVSEGARRLGMHIAMTASVFASTPPSARPQVREREPVEVRDEPANRAEMDAVGDREQRPATEPTAPSEDPVQNMAQEFLNVAVPEQEGSR